MAEIATDTNSTVMQPARAGDTVSSACKVCGHNFAYTQKRTGRRRKFCSAPCKAEWKAAWHIVDRVAKSDRYESYSRTYNAQRRKTAPARTWECTFCGVTFASRSLHNRTACSTACSNAIRRRANLKPAGVVQQGRRVKWKRASERRAAALSFVIREKYTRLEIFERDSWRCGICGGDIDREAKFPARLGASIDHIVPISRGGHDTRANVQAAHYGCNSRKQNRLLNG